MSAFKKYVYVRGHHIVRGDTRVYVETYLMPDDTVARQYLADIDRVVATCPSIRYAGGEPAHAKKAAQRMKSAPA